MKNVLRSTLLIATISLLAACGGPTLDGKNEVAFKTSLEKIVADLPQAEARQFGQDIEVIAGNMMKGKDMFNMKAIQEQTDAMLKTLDGKSVKDVNKMAEKIRKQG